jgi:5'-3' exonuclease
MTGVIFGFLNTIFRIAMKFKTNKFVFVWDSRKSVRKKIEKTYKEHRKKDVTSEDKMLFRQFSDIRQIVLDKFGFRNSVIETGYESDDLIASIVMNSSGNKFIVVTTDSDLYQLLDYCDIYNPIKKKVITKETFKEEHHIDPDKWAMVKAIAGCNSDNVRGVQGIGEKTAIRYLKEELNIKSKVIKKIESPEGQTKIIKNMGLVSLPIEGTKKIVIDDGSFKDEVFYADDFIDICLKYGFESFMKELTKWKETFKMIQRIQEV